MRTINERLEEAGESLSRDGDGEREARSEGRSREDDLLIGVVVLGVIVVVLILIIVYCHCARLKRRRREEMEDGERRSAERRERSSNMREPTEESQQSTENLAPLETLPEVTQLSVQVKTRKRSMTFTETDEECRRYREDLADSGEGPSGPFGAGTAEKDRFRKKSVVSFAGVQEFDSN